MITTKKYTNGFFIIILCYLFVFAPVQASDTHRKGIDILKKYEDKCYEHIRTASDSTLFYATKILEVSKMIESKQWESVAYQFMGSYYIKKGRMAVGFDYELKALTISESLKDWADVATISNNIGVFYFRDKDYRKAIEFYHKGLTSINRFMAESDTILLHQRENQVSMMFNIGEAYTILNENDSALYYLNESFFESLKYGFKEQEFYVIAIRSRVLFNQGKVKQAIQEIQEALAYFKENNNFDAFCEYEIWLADYYLTLDRYILAKEKALDVYNRADIKDSDFWKMESSKMLYQVEYKRNNIENAFHHYKEYQTIKEQIDNVDIKERIAKIKENYSSEKRESEISSLKTEQELNQKVLKQQRQFIFVMVLMFLLMVLGIYLLLKFYLNLKKAYSHITEKNNEIEAQREEILAQKDHLQEYVKLLDTKNKQVQSGINYAKRIQSATLPSRRKMEKLLDDLMIFYKPCGVVSGDFYYYSGKLYKNNERLSIVASIDCTGHGVPGAFMSLIGNGILNEIIKVKNIHSPKEILEGLHQRLQTTLSQYETYGVQDGMDITVACINYSRKIVTVSSAKNSWVYFQNGKQQVVKGDRRSIGGMDTRFNSFINHEIDISQGRTKFYFYTDGYQDQLGGPKDRKFMANNFRNLLEEIKDLPVREQESVLDTTLNNWRKYQGEPQTDDILILSFTVE
ncbi:SpoIIE family protein phosphatase [Flammeovirga agarivorans]|uniref:SpoIIE family protein phosphatase n=1 Tax=Flammeovirga agarivorans TaxID=2726742 RepID=A0A7X8SP02_9BACT|nr:SpoIIE family protein phosphatase [Flammeovirga agarivorans]NLR93655.1 SpoIIE family protein phosphatase [Flammeovirga agarivorans]